MTQFIALRPNYCFAGGIRNMQMGEKLGISIQTVEKHRQSLMNKLHIHEAAGLTFYAIVNGIVSCTRPSLMSPEVTNDVLNVATVSPLGRNQAICQLPPPGWM